MNCAILNFGCKVNQYQGELLRETLISAGFQITEPETADIVFINGCHTTDLDPEQTINLVEAFVRRGGVGVIGTEITIFEPLACSFAEECLRQFMVEKLSIGEAIRKSRLKLLKEGNPLGLVYTPFVLPSLHILEQSIGS